MGNDVSKFLKKYDPEVREITLKIRELIFETLPGIKEKVYGG